MLTCMRLRVCVCICVQCTLYTLALARTKTKQKRMDYSIKTSFFGSYSLWHKLNLVCHRTLTEQVRILRTKWSTQSSWPSKSRKSYSIIIILSWMRERSTVYTFFFHRNFWVRIFENIDFLLCLKRKWVKGFFTICFFFRNIRDTCDQDFLVDSCWCGLWINSTRSSQDCDSFQMCK